jgi:hypothetical protein
MASVIADETYLQQLVDPASGRVLDERRLTSELALVRLAESTEWQAFRDVLTLDGRDVGDGPGRLARVFREAPASVLGQARALAEDSARYNLGPLRRTFNAPTVTLQFLHPSHQDRFEFDRRRRTDCEGHPCWEIAMKERSHGTLIRSPTGRSIPIRGTLWIDPADGRLLRGRFALEGFLDGSRGDPSHAVIDVRWEPNPHVGEWVPAEMREHYDGLPPDPEAAGGPRLSLTGVARYSNYRRFVVDYRIR